MGTEKLWKGESPRRRNTGNNKHSGAKMIRLSKRKKKYFYKNVIKILNYHGTTV